MSTNLSVEVEVSCEVHGKQLTVESEKNEANYRSSMHVTVEVAVTPCEDCIADAVEKALEKAKAEAGGE